jgi:hypothetical protein
MDETDHGLTPRIPDLKVNRKTNEINDLPTPHPRQCWLCVPPVIALKTRGPKKVEQGGLFLLLEGMEPRAVESGMLNLPDAPGLESVDSLNYAFTRLSEVFEPWRKAHTGSIYERVFYLEPDGFWYPLKDLRDRALATAERKLIAELWANVAEQLGTALF